MRVVIDIECNGLHNPTQIWVIVCKDIDTNSYHIFRNITSDENELNRFTEFSNQVALWIGHNFLGYDFIHLQRLTNCPAFHDNDVVVLHSLDTLILSKLIDYPRQGHSIESYGLEFGMEKGKYSDWSKYSLDMEEYCKRDVDICSKIYTKYLSYIDNEEHRLCISIEHRFQCIVNALSSNGFSFNKDKATKLLSKVEEELAILDVSILEAFPPKLKLIREVTPKETKYGTISLTSIPKALRDDIASLSVGSPFSYCTWETFNPSSHKQIVHVLTEASWRPVDKTQTHIDTERELTKLKHTKQRSNELDLRLKELYTKLELMKKVGWKVNETNLETLPRTAPPSARFLAKRILLESRRRTLVEWLGLVDVGDGRIHGRFYGIGAWTHRMAHQQPNTANIPNEFDTFGNKKLLGKELRSLWQAPRGRLLVGVDAEGIQLRIFAHYINDVEFTAALVNGKKEDKSDPHSLNQRILGPVCRSRQAAKRFIYALLLGGGISKLTEILGCQQVEAEDALERLMVRYTGFDLLKREVIPQDARRGWFTGLDGRPVPIPADTVGGRKHLAMSGYLQNGEALVIKNAAVLSAPLLKQHDSFFVDIVHDEFQIETPRDINIA